MTPRLRLRPVVMCTAAALVLGTMAAAQMSGLRVNTTASMPVGLWRVAPVVAELRRGDVVTACPPDAAGASPQGAVWTWAPNVRLAGRPCTMRRTSVPPSEPQECTCVLRSA